MATGERRNHSVNMRLTKSEREAIDRKVGRRNTSDVARKVLLRWARSSQPDETLDDADV